MDADFVLQPLIFQAGTIGNHLKTNALTTQNHIASFSSLPRRCPIAAMDFYEAWDFAEASQGFNTCAGKGSKVPEPDDSKLSPLDFLIFQAASHKIYPDKDRGWFWDVLGYTKLLISLLWFACAVNVKFNFFSL